MHVPTPCFVNLVALVALLTAADSFSLQKLSTTSGGPMQRSGDSWLDRTPVNWNRRMGGLPRPVSLTNPAGVPSRCREFIRQPDSPAERALVRAGWMLYGAVQSYGLTKVVTAMSGADGMCRPLGYQAFVYWQGRYAGTLSPAAMDSRTDGALTNIRIESPTRIIAEFARYNESDPRCCPKRTSQVIYNVTRDDLPLVTPVNVNARPAAAPGEEPSAESASGDARLFGRKWGLTEVYGGVVRTANAYIEFDRSGNRFFGSGGCNRISGVFELDGTGLKFLRVVSTKMACLDNEVQRVETDFLKALEQATSFQIQGDILRLSAGGAPMLTFKDTSTESLNNSQAARVTGTVTHRQRIALTPAAVVEVKLLDVSRADAPAVTIAEQVIKPAGRQVPIAFELRYDPRRIEASRRYVIQARILEGGTPRFINAEVYPVITGGHPSRVDVIVQPVRR